MNINIFIKNMFLTFN